MAPHLTPLTVRFYELDPYGHANHASYVQWFEVGRVEALAAVGCGIDTMLAEGLLLVVTRITTRFVASAQFGDSLIVSSELTEIRRATASWYQRIERHGELLAEQELESAAVSREGRVVRFPEYLVSAVAPLRRA